MPRDAWAAYGHKRGKEDNEGRPRIPSWALRSVVGAGDGDRLDQGTRSLGCAFVFLE